MTKKVMKSHKLVLTDRQLHRLSKGEGVALKHSNMGKGDDIYMSVVKHRRLAKAHEKGKGFRLTLAPDELEHQIFLDGTGIHWHKIGRAIKHGAQWLGKQYREHIRPTVGPALKELVEKGISNAATKGVEGALTYLGAPELAAIAAPEIKEGINNYITHPLSNIIKVKTGAYGLKKKYHRKKGMKKESLKQEIHKIEFPKQIPFKPKLEDNYSQFLNPNHPSQNPHLPLPDNSLPLVARGLYIHGGNGLFMSTGGKIADGTPSDPRLPLFNNDQPRFGRKR